MASERKRIGLREVRGLLPGGTLYDSVVAGFGARRQRGEAVSYFLFYRTAEGRQRWHTIGKHGMPWTPDTARAEALRLLGDVVKGSDPATVKQDRRAAVTVAELCDSYMQAAERGRVLTRKGVAKRASTLATDRSRIESHIRPLLGRRIVASVTPRDIERFMHQVAEGEAARRVHTGPRAVTNVRGGAGAAARTVGLLGAVFSYAVRQGMAEANPVRGVIRPADRKRERRLSDLEYAAFGTALRAAEASVWPAAVACTRFLALTGWRSGEALALRWADLDLSRRVATLPTSKTGRSVRPLANVACDVLASLPRTGELVFPATRGTGPMTGFRKLFDRIAALGAMPADITPNVLRHSFISLGGDLGLSEPTIGALVGHNSGTVTGGYMHLSDGPLLAAADGIAADTLRRMGEVPAGAKVLPMRRAGG